MFHFLAEPTTAEEYRQVGDMLRAVQDFIATPTRTSVRIDCSNLTADEMRTPEGQAKCENAVLASLQSNAKNVPIIIEAVQIRKKDFNDEELRETRRQAAIERQKAQDSVQQAQRELEALQAEAEVRKAQRQIEQEAFEAQLARQEAILKTVAETGLTWEQLWILSAADVIDLELQPDGSLAAPQRYVLPTQP
jgi:regulator of protease activity HflC (stomatin/prohibitin superfamily)